MTKVGKHVTDVVRFNGANDDSLMEVWCVCGEGPFGPGEEEGSWTSHKSRRRREAAPPAQNVWQERPQEQLM